MMSYGKVWIPITHPLSNVINDESSETNAELCNCIGTLSKKTHKNLLSSFNRISPQWEGLDIGSLSGVKRVNKLDRIR
jgi:hypothetical protein